MQINRKTIIAIAIVLLAALLLGGGYIWYTNNYGNMKKIVLDEQTSLDYEWQLRASENGLTGDYLWARTKELMLRNAEDGTLIPSTLMIEGRLVTEPQEESGVYKLSDQALLLINYVRRGDRFAATNLVNEVYSRYDFSTETNYEKSSWLMAFLEYYVAYGKTSDYERITSLTALIFDSDGNIIPESISVASYNSSDYVSLDVIGDDDGHSSLDGTDREVADSYYTFDGVTLSSINLKLIRTLENNNLLPAGSFEKNLELVLNGTVSEDIVLYAYAFEILDDGSISYINSHKYPASVDVFESIVTMRNLSEVGELPNSAYIWLKNTIINNPIIKDSYFFVSGYIDGAEAMDCYTDILHIAINMDDMDLYSRVITGIGGRVATYNNSPALSMVYRSFEDRYIFSARENLEIAIILY